MGIRKLLILINNVYPMETKYTNNNSFMSHRAFKPKLSANSFHTQVSFQKSLKKFL